MKKTFLLLSIAAMLIFGYIFLLKKPILGNAKPTIVNEKTNERLNQQVATIKKFISKNTNYNSKIAFFIDMKIMSGENRFFIYDLQNNKITDEGLVAHGSGSETGIEGKLKFSNTNNSFATSLGKYSTDEKYNGRFGEAYKLTGLDETNSNARSRSIVLHKYNSVPYDEQPDPIVNSLGCPMVNKTYFERLEKIIDNAEKPILLTIYY